MGSKIKKPISPGRIILQSLALLIFTGTALLALPAARTQAIPLLDLLFTATSATCVTGLFTISFAHFTFFGKCIILTLIQIGGVGLITMMLFAMSLFSNLGFATQLMAGKVLELESWTNIKRLLFFIITLTLSFELIGSGILYIHFSRIVEPTYAYAYALFYAISAFCNAGITPFDGSFDIAVGPQNTGMLIILMILMLTGGLGFITWYEIFNRVCARLQDKRHTFSLQSKIILYASSILIVLSSIIIWILERENAFKTLSPLSTCINTLFCAVSARGTGFTTLPTYVFQPATLFFVMAIAFVGSAPGSTGSGIKITTFVLMIATIKAALSDKSRVDLKGRRIPKDQIYRAIAIIMMSLCWIMFTTFCLLITEKNTDFFSLFFESVSAFTTLGLSTGITHNLSIIGKLLILLSMIIGRVGSFTLILGLKFKSKPEVTEYTYPEERIMIG